MEKYTSKLRNSKNFFRLIFKAKRIEIFIKQVYDTIKHFYFTNKVKTFLLTV